MTWAPDWISGRMWMGLRAGIRPEQRPHEESPFVDGGAVAEMDSREINNFPSSAKLLVGVSLFSRAVSLRGQSALTDGKLAYRGSSHHQAAKYHLVDRL